MHRLLWISDRITEAELYLLKTLKQEDNFEISILQKKQKKHQYQLLKFLKIFKFFDRRLQPMKIAPENQVDEYKIQELGFLVAQKVEKNKYEFIGGSHKDKILEFEDCAIKSLIILGSFANFTHDFFSLEESIPIFVNFFIAGKYWSETQVIQMSRNMGYLNTVEKYLWYRILAMKKFLNNFETFSNSEQHFKEKKEKIAIIKIFKYYFKICFYLIQRHFSKKKYNWKLGVQYGNEPQQLINQPKGSFWADPFLAESESNQYVFFEELNRENGLGEIACGRLQGNIISDKKTVLADKTHFSFPNVFHKNNSWWMIPENSASGTLDIYLAKEFPYSWEKHSTLIHQSLVDAVWIQHDNKIWMFANKIHEFEYENNETLYIFYSDSIFSNEWKSHKMNPVVCSKETSRNAGNIYKIENKIYRKSQSSLNRYGESIQVMEIVNISEDNYQEILQTKYLPPEGFLGFHTLNKLGSTTVFDYLSADKK